MSERYTSAIEDYNLRAALDENGVALTSPVDAILLQLTGENDERSWHWIVRLADGRAAYITGSCDYTGWDCISSCHATEHDTIDAAIADAPEEVARLLNEMRASGETERSTP